MLNDTVVGYVEGVRWQWTEAASTWLGESARDDIARFATAGGQ